MFLHDSPPASGSGLPERQSGIAADVIGRLDAGLAEIVENVATAAGRVVLRTGIEDDLAHDDRPDMSVAFSGPGRTTVEVNGGTGTEDDNTEKSDSGQHAGSGDGEIHKRVTGPTTDDGKDEKAAAAGGGYGNGNAGTGGGRRGGGGNEDDDGSDGRAEDPETQVDRYGFRAGHGVVRSAEDMTEDELREEYAEATNLIRSGHAVTLDRTRLSRNLEVTLAQPRNHGSVFEDRRIEQDMALYAIGEVVDEGWRDEDGNLRLITVTPYRSIAFLDAFQDVFRARLDGRQLTQAEREALYVRATRLTAEMLDEMSRIELADNVRLSSPGVIPEAWFWGALAESAAFSAGARPSGQVLFVPTPSSIRTNDASVLFTSPSGRRLELAVDFKLGGKAKSVGAVRSSINVGGIARAAVDPHGRRSGDRHTIMCDSLAFISSLLVEERRQGGLGGEKARQLDRFASGLRNRVAELGRNHGVPNILERLRF